jgi:HK97 family phage major capsid protein
VDTALVGDFRRAMLFDRETTSISIGTAGDDFIRNLVRVLAELRAGFVVIRPAAFVAVTLS